MNKEELQEIKTYFNNEQSYFPKLCVQYFADTIAAVEELQAENEQLEERDEMAKRLADYCRMTIETGELNYGSSIAVAYRDYMAMREEQKESKE